MQSMHFGDELFTVYAKLARKSDISFQTSRIFTILREDTVIIQKHLHRCFFVYVYKKYGL
ncbi:hypothetical protein DV714_05220 [Parageobacillus thermoglucosidasius]|uniref:Uncharacterized protein n=1 Tax=Geobacillus sp. (strain Y4.1MC1) TaxID=581103 RepID=A0A7U3YIQ4_GEOS0|nr:hypothetical protein Geoth_3555 [Parageobacillus thermoglucosidasius C56-YS93]RDE28991.1 hypothetical protein DV714_05220 [Parageobacillus thermoglucosidasius]